MNDAEGLLWPSTFFKKAAGSAFKDVSFPACARLFDAAHSPNADENRIIGWGIAARTA